MFFNDELNECSCCSVVTQINNAECTLECMNRAADSIIERYLIDNRALEKISEEELPIEILPMTFKQVVYQSCGSCRKEEYRLFESKESIVLEKVCNILKYVLYNHSKDIDLCDLRETTMGDYSTLSYCVDKVISAIE